MAREVTGFYFAVNASAGSRAISYSKRQMERNLRSLLEQIPAEIRPQLHYQKTLNFFYFCHDHPVRNDLLAMRKIIEEGVVGFRSRVSNSQSSDYHRAGYMLSFHKGSNVERFVRRWSSPT